MRCYRQPLPTDDRLVTGITEYEQRPISHFVAAPLAWKLKTGPPAGMLSLS
jgi:hypothetical protein